MKYLLSLLSFALAGCGAEAASVQGGITAYSQNKIDQAEKIFFEIGADPAAAPRDKASALRETARIAWLIDGDDARALRLLDTAIATGTDVCDAFSLRDRILRRAERGEELLAGFAAQLARCPTRSDQEGLYLQAADAALGLAAAGRSDHPARAWAFLDKAGDDARKSLPGSALALEAGLLGRDGAASLQAWKDYFWLAGTDAPQALTGYASSISALFARGAGAEAAVGDRLALLDLLVRAGFARAAERFARLHRLDAVAGPHPLWRKASAYLRERAKLEAILLASNRRVARGGKADNLNRALAAAGDALIAAAGARGDRKRALQDAYGLYGMAGDTGGFTSVHFGHVVQSERRTIDQYGHRADVGFVALDNMISNGYETWLWDGSAAAGGWTEDGPVTVQVRPEYTDGPLRAWRLAADPAGREELRARQKERVASDRIALALAGTAYLPGLSDRLRLQVTDQIAARARALAGAGGDLRRAFLDEYWRASFQQSIFLHEGRHALDRKLVTGLARLIDTNLEYRAKLSELALADYPRLALLNINSETIGGDTPHGKANAKVMAAYGAWIHANRANVAGFDPNLPALAQADRLSDDQLRAVARALDPIAK